MRLSSCRRSFEFLLSRGQRAAPSDSFREEAMWRPAKTILARESRRCRSLRSVLCFRESFRRAYPIENKRQSLATILGVPSDWKDGDFLQDCDITRTMGIDASWLLRYHYGWWLFKVYIFGVPNTSPRQRSMMISQHHLTIFHMLILPWSAGEALDFCMEAVGLYRALATGRPAAS